VRHQVAYGIQKVLRTSTHPVRSRTQSWGVISCDCLLVDVSDTLGESADPTRETQPMGCMAKGDSEPIDPRSPANEIQKAMGFLIVGVWMFTLLSGGSSARTYRVADRSRAANMLGIAWTRGDARRLCRAIGMNRSLKPSAMPDALEQRDELLLSLGASVKRS
jgi:hypothetical protein